MSRLLSSRRPPRLGARQRGFSLIELVAAFVVFALAFGVLMGILSASIRNTRLAAEYTQAALWAQSRLDVVGIGEKLEAGHESGRFDNQYRWELDISKYEPPPLPVASGAPHSGGVESFQSIELYRVDLEVLWGGDRRGSKSAHFVSLRSKNAEAGNGAAGSAAGGNGDVNGNQDNKR
ncbi:general secretion pathway protein I [Tahibacter aquaticus]|jgi:general secretion pathway protein I|uniref:General secretion pathway protein I n=1 Tax=Tahibacter aquaticus TaxID=520092 RepID=A0A4R6ZA23_9GAMM|nr:type II secretion system protein [Tahibacter aquaticus]TDR48778.1 general secretion pathway protein I [Tahibacter aquaticus]